MSTKALEIHEHKTLFRRSLGILALVVVLSFVVFVLRPMNFLKGPFSFGADQPPAATGMSVEAALFRYRCDQASEYAREAIDYYADPCEDFHAYACGRLRGKDRAQLEDDRSRLQRVLLQLSLLNESNHVAVQAAVLFKSCLNMPLSLEIVLRENMLQFLNVTKLSAKTMLGSLKTPQDVANFSALLSCAHGVGPFVHFESALNQTVAVSFSRPFSAYLDRRAVHAVVEEVTKLLDISEDQRYKAVNLMLADQELTTVLTKVNTFHVTIEDLASATEGAITSFVWNNILQDYGTQSAHEASSAPTNSVERLKQVFTVIFSKLSPREAAVYAMAHTLLPTQILEVLFDDHRTDACFRLVGEILGTTWHDLQSYVLGFFDEKHEAQSVADSLISTLQNMLEDKAALDKEKSDAAIDTIKKLRFDMPSIEEVASLVRSTACRANLRDHSLYRNLMKCRDFSQNVPYGTAPYVEGAIERRHRNGAIRRSERSSLSTTTILLPLESLSLSSFCHGHESLLNYATLGTEMAATLLRYFAVPLDGAAFSHSTAEGKETLLPGLTSNISTCLSRASQNRLLGKLLDHIALQTVAFQVALRASKSYASAWTRIENAADAPAWKQTYFVKYCQRLCSKDVSRSSTVALDAAIVCNSVVMNSPEFAQLFRCERGDPMVPSEYCSAL